MTCSATRSTCPRRAASSWSNGHPPRRANRSPPKRRGSSAELVFTGTGRELILASGPPTLGVTVGEDKHRLRDATCRWLDVPQLSKTDFKGINAACVALKTLRDGPPPAGRREARWTMNAWEQLSWKGQKLKQVRGGFA